MAFHLHRLKLIGRRLHEAGYHQTDAADLAAARFAASPKLIRDLAQRLDVTPHDLTRPLTAEERRTWDFYRTAAADPHHVWEVARTAWREHGLSNRKAAAIMGFTERGLSNAMRRGRVLQFPAAFRLTSALRLPTGPTALLPPDPTATPQPSRSKSR